MDIRCPKCGEPWDMDCLHEAVDSGWPSKPWVKDGKHDGERYDVYYRLIAAEFRRKGCRTFEGARCDDTEAPASVRAIYDFCGDDMDEAASMMDG